MNKIALADAIMFVGHCDYQPRSWHSRTYIRGPNNEPLMLSVPVRKGISINETQIFVDRLWRDKHLKTIEQVYSGCPYFRDYYPEIRDTIMEQYDCLSDLNIALIRVLMHQLGIDTKTYRSEPYDIHLYYGQATKMLAEICAKLGARHYLSSPGEVKYFKKEHMNGFGHSFQRFEHPKYLQWQSWVRSRRHHPFLENLSVIDLLFNEGPASAKIVRDAGHI